MSDLHVPGRNARHIYCSREDARQIAVAVGQEVYDKIVEQHYASMDALMTDFQREVSGIKDVVAYNIIELQQHSLLLRTHRLARRARLWLTELLGR